MFGGVWGCVGADQPAQRDRGGLAFLHVDVEHRVRQGLHRLAQGRNKDAPPAVREGGSPVAGKPVARVHPVQLFRLPRAARGEGWLLG